MEKMEERVGLRLDFFIESGFEDEDSMIEESCMNCGRAKEPRKVNNSKLGSHITCTDCGSSFDIGL